MSSCATGIEISYFSNLAGREFRSGVLGAYSRLSSALREHVPHVIEMGSVEQMKNARRVIAVVKNVLLSGILSVD